MALYKFSYAIIKMKTFCLWKYYICQFIAAKYQGLFRKLTDNSIVEGIRCQDEKVLGYIYDHYFQTIKNHVLQNSGSIEDVSDVFQDTIIALYQQISENNFNLTSDLKGYFFGIARNIWNTQLRRKKRILELNVDIPEEEDSNDLSDPALERILSRSFKKLKPDSQTVLTLFYDGLSYEEIAFKMNFKNEAYARRKKYLSKEALLDIIKEDPEYQEYQRFLK
jgi:RNA polymerase sigma factor (sigma-70 family)